jgi:hypothetical protein
MGNQPSPQTPASAFRRAFYAVTVVILVLIVGTIGFHLIEGASYIDAFYFESMLATGQGPPFAMTTDAGKLFASLMAFVSIASVATSIFFTLGPILVQMWREGVERVEKEAREIEEEFHGGKKKEEGKA